MKYCFLCKLIKPLSAFAKNKARTDGLNNRCRPCDTNFRRIWRAKNRSFRPSIRINLVRAGFCTVCRNFKSIFNFSFYYISHNNTPVFRHQCKRCVTQNKKPRPKIKKMEDKLKQYGIDLRTYTDLVEKHDGKCAICRIDKPGGVGRWHLDHDHNCCPQPRKVCGKCIRGILCASCNIGLGNFKDNPALLKLAAVYLESYLTKIESI